jgi:hypothetical protein
MVGNSKMGSHYLACVEYSQKKHVFCHVYIVGFSALADLALHQDQHHQQFRVSHFGLFFISIAGLCVHYFG